MEIQPYLTFNGDCREAFEVYAEILGGEIPFIETFKNAPEDIGMPEEMGDRVMHARLVFGGNAIFASDDFAKSYKPPSGMNLQLDYSDPEEASTAFDALAAGGSTMMKFGPTPYAKGFGIATDRFGITWMVNCWADEYAEPGQAGLIEKVFVILAGRWADEYAEPGQAGDTKLVPYLTFDGDATEAFERYAELLGGAVTFRMTFGDSMFADRMPPESHGKVMNSRLKIGGRMLMASDNHQGNYEPPSGMNVNVSVGDIGEARRIFDALAAGGEIRMAFEKTFWAEGFGMVVDRHGIPWMVNCDLPEPG